MILGILGRLEKFPNSGAFTNRYYITEFFKTIADRYDIILFPILSTVQMDKVAEICDGLLVSGTASNVRPHYYNEDPLPDMKYEVDEYPLDVAAIRAFDQLHKPMFGICGGIQSLNVYFGGTLHQRLENHGKGHQHRLHITEGSFLDRVYHTNEMQINTYHGQAVKTPAPGFTVCGVSEDGVIEAIERDNVIAVQWHPEVLLDYSIFEYFFDMMKKQKEEADT